jgi:transcriptional regulator NrdR family protein
MNCPKCNGGTKVVDRRSTRRRRECLVCQNRFTTLEVLPEDVVKKFEPREEPVVQTVKIAKPKTAPKQPNKITISAVKRNADARRKIEDLRDFGDSFMDPDFDYLPERW